MENREWQIGLFGTFDVENYGDLLFPLIAEAELSERLGKVRLHPFSYQARTPPEWPYTVTSLTELPQIADSLDGVLIGGGFIIRFDKEIAPDYGPPAATIHHPTGYWLTPALIALQHGVPLVWNAPGMHCNDVPSWAEPLMELAFTLSRYIAVRDEPSRAALTRFASNNQISVLPDTGFGISRLLNNQPALEFSRLREASGLTGPYIILQAASYDDFLSIIKRHGRRLQNYRILVLPIGPVLTEQVPRLDVELANFVSLPVWPHPLLIAQLISQAEAVIGYSYHLAITAISFGVPVFTPVDLSVGKYSALAGFNGVYPMPNGEEFDPDQFFTHLGKTVACPKVDATLDTLARHWDRVADAIRSGGTGTQPYLNQFWQSLPGLLEGAATRLDRAVKASEIESAELRQQIEAQAVNSQRQIDEQSTVIDELESEQVKQQSRIEELSRLLALAHKEIATRDARVDELSRLVALARGEIIARDARITLFQDSTSWKVTTPLRFVGRNLKRLAGSEG